MASIHAEVTKMKRKRVHLFFFTLMLGLCLSLLFLTGCTRKKYRMSADKEVYGLLNNVGDPDTLWSMNDFTIEENGQSRYANPYDRDKQPMPQDDALAHRYMEEVDGKRGSRKWNKNGCTDLVENPSWKESLPRDEEGRILLNQDTIFDLALLHSPSYRTALENVYIAALNVTAERFAFDTQFFGGDSLFYTNQGAFRSDSTSRLTNEIGPGSAGAVASRKLATGGDVIVNIANSMVWTFGGGGQTFSPTTTLGYGITQPFLRGAGRQIVLESLTRSERQLLANVRQLAFYQQGFYIGVLTGSYAVNAPSSGGYPSRNVGSVSRSGYYGLLSSQVQIRNQIAQVQSLKENLDQYEEFFKAGKLDNSLQVEQVRSQFLSGQSTLMSLKNSYENSIESYLISIGLPPDLGDVAIEDSLLDQFTLMSPGMTTLYEQMNDEIERLHNRQEPMSDNVYALIQEFYRGILEGDKDLLADFDHLLNTVPSRTASMEALAKRLAEEQPELDRSICDTVAFHDRIEAIRSDYHAIKEEIQDLFRLMDLTIKRYDPQTLASMIVETRANPSSSPFDRETVDLILKLRLEDIFDEDKLSEEITDDSLRVGRVTTGEMNATGTTYDIREPYRYWVSTCLSALSEKLTTFRLVQTRIRLESVELPVIDLDPVEAFAVARENRLDWMNARSELVDTWRNIEIVANQLKSYMSVSVSGQARSSGSNPLHFDAQDMEMSTSLKFDAPLTRLLERNEYRRALISYDQARRSYYSYVDNVNMQIRQTLRAIYHNQLDLELKRESVRVSIIQVHQAQLKLSKPATSASRSVGDTSARDLVEALNSLLSSQNNFMTTWLEYQVQRMAILLELGLFEIDENGRWIDPGTIDAQLLAASMPAAGQQTQDQLAGLSVLRPVEEVSGGLSAESLQRMAPVTAENSSENEVTRVASRPIIAPSEERNSGQNSRR